MSEDLKRQIRQRMLEKDTEELMEIWKKNNRAEWSDEAFEAIREILMNRIGDLPMQSEADNAELPATEQDEDTYYNFHRLARVASWASLLSWFFLGAGALLIVVGLFQALLDLTAFGVTHLMMSSLLGWFLAALVTAFLFVTSQALAEGIYILMDIEHNTRHATRGGK